MISLTAGGVVLLLSGCPDFPGAAPANRHTTADKPGHRPDGGHDVGEIAWFQGTIDEAFSHRGCPDRHPRRTLFRL
ncbi:MAG: hypothetical protein JO184_04815 [Gammaproteobacteria bacterium]|nr:hypothetical protein [Gammaproteobacteria bacterium]MBV8307888.1 hypothetical protein [Gammaproteobacteria bacterium]MBV8405368.1 hypothetical protein [Gammaproteobacteria bacterium]